MASVSKKSKAPAPRVHETARGAAAVGPWPLRALDAVYRFLASLKLAVMLLTTLAAVLIYATVYEKVHGTQAVQLDVYRSKPFALLLAMLGVNVLCAATIRFPWKRRQTGFVITHAGLIVLLIGSFVSLKVTDNGEVALLEGTRTAEFIRPDNAVIRVQKLDGETGEVRRQFVVPFSPGAQPWGSEALAAQAKSPGYESGVLALRAALVLIAGGLLAAVLYLGLRHGPWVGRPLGASLTTLMTLGALGIGYYGVSARMGPRQDVLTSPGDPFRLVVKDFLPSASEPRPVREPGEDGVPMLRVALLTQPPGQAKARDAFDGRGWLVASPQLAHGTLGTGPARLEYQALRGPHAADALDAFLHPPDSPLSARRARFYYDDDQGRHRSFDFDLGRATRGEAFALPDSGIRVTYLMDEPFATGGEGLRELGELNRDLVRMLIEAGLARRTTSVNMALFRVKDGDGPEAMQAAWAGLPLAPADPRADAPTRSRVWIDYFEPPPIQSDPGAPMMGTFGAVQFVTGPDGSTYYRAFGRDGLKGVGPLKLGEPVKVFGGDRMPMQVSVRADEYLPSGVTRYVCEPVRPGPEEREVPAALVSMTVDGQTQEFWLPQSLRHGPDYQRKLFGDEFWTISYDFEQGGLPFEVNLVDFNPSNDPGAKTRSAYRSDVYLSDLDGEPPAPKSFSALPDGQAFLFLDRPRETFVKASDTTYRPFDGGEAVAIADAETSVRPIPTPQKITMNNPMVRQNWTLYQSEFAPQRDQDGIPTGTYTSILTTRYDPAWPITYSGGLLVAIGAFLQFYMMGLGKIFRWFRDTLLGGGRAARGREAREEPAELAEADVVL
jgi:hypothetical protein